MKLCWIHVFKTNGRKLLRSKTKNQEQTTGNSLLACVIISSTLWRESTRAQTIFAPRPLHTWAGYLNLDSLRKYQYRSLNWTVNQNDNNEAFKLINSIEYSDNIWSIAKYLKEALNGVKVFVTKFMYRCVSRKLDKDLTSTCTEQTFNRHFV